MPTSTSSSTPPGRGRGRRGGSRPTPAPGLRVLAPLRVVAAALAVATVLAGCGFGGGGDEGGAQGRTGTGATAGARPVAAPDPTRCPAGAGAAAGDGQPALADTAVGRARAPRGPFLVDPHSQAAQQAAAVPASAAQLALLMRTPTAFSVGDWITDVAGEVHSRAAAARAGGTTAVLMVYGIPHRDVGAGYSAGGFPDGAAYRQFTRQVAAGIGDARAVIVLEPDSLGQIDQLPAAQVTERYALLRDAVDVYAGLPATSVYLDGTNCGWVAPAEMARRLGEAGVAHARGFAVNVANYYRTEDEAARAEILAGLLGDAHYVVDTSRNGRGPASGLADAWCNPPGRGTGATPTTDTGYPHADAFLWVKTPGASDGECGRNNPPAGTWWPQAAADLVRNGVG